MKARSDVLHTFRYLCGTVGFYLEYRSIAGPPLFRAPFTVSATPTGQEKSMSAAPRVATFFYSLMVP